jgi:hemoglobin-like flavoprotein
MGAGASTVGGGGTIEEQTEAMMPAYILRDQTVSNDDLQKAKEAWQLIVDDKSPKYLELKENGLLESTSCLSWFYDSFYRISDSIDTESKEIYRDNLKVQIKALVGMVTMSLNLFKDVTKMEKTLGSVAKGHNKKGVVSYQYPLVGEILLKTFAECLGEAWDEQTSLAWTKIVSITMLCIVPLALKVEKEMNTNQSPKKSTIRSSITSTARLSVKEKVETSGDKSEMYA